MDNVFVGAPYSANPVGNIEKVKKFVSGLIRKGKIVHCPMLIADQVYTQPQVNNFTGRDWELWTEKYLRFCDSAIFLQLEGFEESSGVDNEIAICVKNRIPFKILSEGEFDVV